MKMEKIVRKTNDIYTNRMREYKDEDIIQEWSKQIAEKIAVQKDKFIEDALRRFAKPPIKGEITKGKIKWRGIVVIDDTINSKMWLRQRGVDIPFVFDYKIRIW